MKLEIVKPKNNNARCLICGKAVIHGFLLSRYNHYTYFHFDCYDYYEINKNELQTLTERV